MAFKVWLKNNPYLAALIVLGLVFFLLYSHLSWVSSSLYNSPDETANLVFSRHLEKTGQLIIDEPLNLEVGNVIHPRSVNVTPSGQLVPGSFLGLIIIYGWLAKFFGQWLLIFLTPLLSVLAVIAFYYLIKNIFNKQVAFLSAILLYFQPAFWYYSSRGFMPNALFLDLLIASLLFLFVKKPWAYALSGFLIGLAFSVRLTAVLWFLPWLVVMTLLSIKRLKHKKIVKSYWLNCLMFVIFLALAILPTAYYQKITYGQAFKIGYASLENDLAPTSWLASFSDILLPFGFHPRVILNNFVGYYLKFFWWLFLPALGGFLLWLKKYRKLTDKERYYGWSVIFLTVFLTVYYGSGFFPDNPTPWHITIGNSQVRYWLPMYVFSLPWAAWFLLFISRLNFSKNNFGRLLKKAILPICLLIIIYFSFSAVLWRDEEGLLAIKANLGDYSARREVILSLTEANSVILVQRGDKVIWPERRVALLNDWLAKPDVWPVLSSQAPLYGYLDFSGKDFDDFATILASQGLEATKIKDFSNNEDLYKIVKLEP